MTAGLALVVIGIVSTRTHPWGSAQTISVLAAGAALLVAFAVIEARLADHPLVPLAVFRRRSLTAANGVSVTVGASILSLFFFLSLYLQQINRYTPLRAGLAFLPLGLSILSAALLAARLVARLGVRRQLVIGLLLGAAGLAWMTQLTPGDGYWPSVFLPELLTGTGFGLSFLPMTLGATAGIPPQVAYAVGRMNAPETIRRSRAGAGGCLGNRRGARCLHRGQPD